MTEWTDTEPPEPPPDVLDELRAGAAAMTGTRWGWAMKDAADEIERLRAEISALRAEVARAVETERERCAKVCESFPSYQARDCAQAIRGGAR